jgi:predicted nuclease with TOPRIM domain
MISLEQVKLLDSKVSRLISYIKKANEENTQLKERLNSYQNRIDELEILVKQFKQEQSKIEDGILSALDRLNQFEDAVEGTFSTDETTVSAETIPTAPARAEQQKAEQQKKETKKAPGSDDEPLVLEEQSNDPGELDIF